MAEVTYKTLPLLGQGYSLNLSGKGHPIAKRGWETYNDLVAYVNDPNDSAVSGIVLTVTSDPIPSKNGAYLVKSIAGDQNFTETVILKLATGESQTIKLADNTPKEVAYVENNTLHIEDMRCKWEDNSFENI